MYLKNKFLLFVIAIVLGLSSCKKWEEHVEVVDPLFESTLLEQINSNPELSLFSQYLKDTKQDSVLASSKSFTIWAPTNAALQALDPSVVNNIQQLTLLVRNHISNQSYFAAALSDTIRIRALNGKNVFFYKGMFEDANVTKSDIGVGNGVLHIVDKAIMPKMSIWEFINADPSVSLQKSKLLLYSDSTFVPSKAVLLGYDAAGMPIYEAGTGYDRFNSFLMDEQIDNEDSLFTYFVLNDVAFASETAKLAPFYKVYIGSTVNNTLSAEATDDAAVRNLSVRGLYTVEQIPDTLYSANDRVILTIDKSKIERSYRASNGIVHVMKSISYNLPSKLKTVIIQGERGFTLQSNKTIRIRNRRNAFHPDQPGYKTIFTDLMIENHGVANFWVRYMPTLNSVKYKVYARAVRDFNLVPANGQTDLQYFKQRIAFKDSKATNLGYFTVPVKKIPSTDPNLPPTFEPSYDEIYVGEYLNTGFGLVPTFLVADNTKENGKNTLLLDYIRLVPVP